MKVSKNVLCCYCGEQVATTRDHIPPKSIFNKPRPVNLITVPCCFNCNNSASSMDDIFKSYLGMHVAKEGGEGERLFKEGTLPTTRKNKKLLRSIITSMKNISGDYQSILWDSEAHDITVERIVRGLFYHHFKKVIGKHAIVSVYWFDREHKFFEEYLSTVDVGQNAFTYRYAKADDHEYASMWYFSFYGSHFAGGLILPKPV